MTRKNGDRIIVVAGRSTPGSDGGKNSDGEVDIAVVGGPNPIGGHIKQ